MNNVIRFADYERRSRTPDAVSPRDPADSAIVIILPIVVYRDVAALNKREEIWR